MGGILTARQIDRDNLKEGERKEELIKRRMRKCVYREKIKGK